MSGDISVQPCPGGPLLVRGASTVTDAEGHEHPVSRPVVALCVCGRSGSAPWCDGTHKLLRSAGSSAPIRKPR